MDEYLNELESVLTSDSVDPDLIKNIFTKAIEKEKQTSIGHYQKKDKETLKLKSVLKELGYDNSIYSSMDEFKESFKNNKSSGTDESILREKTVAEQIKALQDQLDQERTVRSEAEKKIKNKTIESELTKALGDKIYGAEDFIQLAVLRGDLQILDDQIVTSEGKPFNDYIATVLESKKGQLKVVQNPGVNILPRQTNESGTRSFRSIEEINSLTPSEIQKYAKEIRTFLANKK